MSASQRSVRRSIAGVVLLGLLGLGSVLLPGAAAEERTLSVSEKAGWPKIDPVKDDRVDPEITLVGIEYAFQVTVPAATACVGSVVLELTGPPPSDKYVTTLSPKRIVKTFSDAADGSAVSTNGTTSGDGWVTVLSVQLSRNAPAFKGIEFAVSATAYVEKSNAAECNIEDSAPALSSAVLLPDYMARVQIQPKTYSMNGGQNQQISFPITIINDSNGPTKVTTTIKERTPGLEAVMGPIDTLLESRTFTGPTARDTQEVVVSARTPHGTGYTNKVYLLDVTFSATADTFATGELSREEKTVTLMLKVQGVYVPGIDGSVALSMLGSLVALMAWSRRREEA